MKRVLIDVDDVLAEFRRGYFMTARRVLGLNVEWSQCQGSWDVDSMMNLTSYQSSQVWKTINGPGWCRQLEPLEGAIEAVERIAQKYEVSFVTKPLKTSPTWGYDRYQWIKKNFGAHLARNLHNTGQKYAVDGNYLIEDRIDNLVDWLKDRGEHSKRQFKAIIYAWPYNEVHTIETQYHVRLPDWPSIVNYLEC